MYQSLKMKTGGVRRVDEEKLAVSMWEGICKMRGWPESTPYEIKDRCDNTNWTWVLIQRKQELIGDIRKDLAERDGLSESDRSMLEDMLEKYLEELEELMNPDDEDAKMKKKKKEEDYERDIVSRSPLMAMADRRCRSLKRKADEGDEKATKALAKHASSCF